MIVGVVVKLAVEADDLWLVAGLLSHHQSMGALFASSHLVFGELFLAHDACVHL